MFVVPGVGLKRLGSVRQDLHDFQDIHVNPEKSCATELTNHEST